MAYTQAGLAIGHGAFDDWNRFINKYNLPPGRRPLSATSLDSQYKVKRVLDAGAKDGGIGNLSEGIDLVVKKEPPRKNQVYILKRIPINPSDGAVLKREIELLHVLKHPNIIAFIDGYLPANINGQAHLVVEYCDRGSLSDLIKQYLKYNRKNLDRPPAYIPEAFIWHVFESLASALAYIHFGIKGDDLRNPSVPMDKQAWPMILHRDVKPDNIFLKSSPIDGKPNPTDAGTHSPQSLSSKMKNRLNRISGKNPNQTIPPNQIHSSYPKVILADFGVCTQENEPDWNDAESCIGTITWMSPEVPDITARSEVWAVGAIIMSLCLLLIYGPIREPPSKAEEDFRPTGDPNTDCENWFTKPYARRGVRDRWLGPNYSQELKQLVRKTVRYTTKDRPRSHVLLDNVRTTRAELGMRLEPLPDWALRKD